MTPAERRDICLILERRDCDHPWLDHEWVVTGIAGPIHGDAGWKLLDTTVALRRYLSPPCRIELHRADAEAYAYNLQASAPSLFVVLREDETADKDGVPYLVHLVSASPYEAQDYLDSSEEIVQRVALDDDLAAWLERFVGEHHHQQPFKKRKRGRTVSAEHKFGQEPVAELRKRGKPADSGDAV
ncbi:MAG: DUF3305 domain-containing protein [Rhodobiaceae bacterium]|nr:DUF3305 domain-containing protein [Rhodobiaceae bacterium]